jgi:hypothetical protein
MAKKNEAQLTEDDVRNEVMDAVNVGAHWAYLFGVLGGGFLLMVALIAVLGGQP